MISDNKKSLLILLNWNGSEDTLACCDSLTKDSEPYDVLIIDNASEEENFSKLLHGLRGGVCEVVNDSLQDNALLDEYQVHVSAILRYGHKKLFVLRSSVNHGFAKGCNLGARYASIYGYSSIMFLNNDTVVESDFFPKMLTTLKNCDAVIPQIRYFHDKSLIWNCGGDITKYGKRKYHFANQHANCNVPGNLEFSITFATGCALLFRTDYFIKIGMFSEKFFFGEEDIDLSLRLMKLQSKLICNPQAVIYHKVGASLAGDSTKLLRKAYIHYLNRFVNMKNHLGIMWFPWLIPSTIKIVINLMRINKLSLGESLHFAFKILKDAFVLEEVNKSKFETILNKGY